MVHLNEIGIFDKIISQENICDLYIKLKYIYIFKFFNILWILSYCHTDLRIEKDNERFPTGSPYIAVQVLNNNRFYIQNRSNIE